VLSHFVGRVVIANPILVRAIAWAKVKTDKIDAAVLAKLHASGFLPEVWMPDEETERVVASWLIMSQNRFVAKHYWLNPGPWYKPSESRNEALGNITQLMWRELHSKLRAPFCF